MRPAAIEPTHHGTHQVARLLPALACTHLLFDVSEAHLHG
jgi:hypothetical protein